MEKQNSKSAGIVKTSRFKETAKEQFSKLKSLVEAEYNNSVDYIHKNPATTFKIGATALAFSFIFGYISGTNSRTADRLDALNQNVRVINQQNFKIANSLQEMITTYTSLNVRVENLEKQSKARLNSLENKIQFKEAVQKGEEHVKKMEKRRGWKKILPWNW